MPVVFTELVKSDMFLGVELKFTDITESFDQKHIDSSCNWGRYHKHDSLSDFLEYARPAAIKKCKKKYAEAHFVNTPFSVWNNGCDSLIIGKFLLNKTDQNGISLNATTNEANELIDAIRTKLVTA